MKEFKYAELALQYRSDLIDLKNKLSTCSDETKSVFMEKLNSEPDISSETLMETLEAIIYEELNPYKSDEQNLAYREIAPLGPEAIKEFNEVIATLPESVNLSIVVETLKDKYSIYEKVHEEPAQESAEPTIGTSFEKHKSDFKNAESSQLPSTHTDGWVFDPVVPWRRYAARIFDITLNGYVLGFLIGVVAFQVAPYEADMFFNNLNPFLDILLTSLLGCLATGVLTGYTGSTVGKWIFGIRVMNPHGEFIGIKNGISRDLTVWMKGLAFGIPIAILVTLYMSHSELKNRQTTAWDSNKYVILHRPSGSQQYILNFVGIVSFFVMTALIRIFGGM